MRRDLLATCSPGRRGGGGCVSELVSTARELHARGFHVFPCDHPDQQRCIGKHGPGNPCDGMRGKHPAVSWGTWAQTVTAQMIDLVWTKHGGQANPAVSCGPSNLVILDEDEAGALDEWCTTYGITLPATYIVTTGRGRHLYFRWDHDAQPIGNSPKVFGGRKIDVRGYGGYAIAEGARHASGATYTGNGLDVAELPAEVAEMLIAANNGGATDETISASERFLAVDRASPVPEKIEMHTRHQALIAYAGRLRKSGLDYAEAEPAYRLRWLLCVQPVGQIPEAEHHDPDCPYPVTWDEALAKLRDVYRRYPAGQAFDEEPVTSAQHIVDEDIEPPLYGDVAALLDGTLPPPPTPTILRREDGSALFYRGEINSLIGDPEDGKTFVTLAAIAQALIDGGSAAFIDMDHNGLASVVDRLLTLGAPPEALRELQRFRYTDPQEDTGRLARVVADCAAWAPDVVVIDSVGELVSTCDGNSDSTDDYTRIVNTHVLPLVRAGAAVILIDHFAKGKDSRAYGAGGTMAKRRKLGGALIRVDPVRKLVRGKGGELALIGQKDRHSGVRSNCEPLARGLFDCGTFVLDEPLDGPPRWHITSRSQVPRGLSEVPVADQTMRQLLVPIHQLVAAAAGGDFTVADLIAAVYGAERIGSHRSSIRRQLDKMTATGLLVVTYAGTAGGDPRRWTTATAEDPWTGSDDDK
ncbi:MAG: bifunctional DNA primase/polymerase [Actinobacteria bacterium]|nr:bifunctional DNA primase/polymerase [Actinomycetota bacterium]